MVLSSIFLAPEAVDWLICRAAVVHPSPKPPAILVPRYIEILGQHREPHRPHLVCWFSHWAVSCMGIPIFKIGYIMIYPIFIPNDHYVCYCLLGAPQVVNRGLFMGWPPPDITTPCQAFIGNDERAEISWPGISETTCLVLIYSSVYFIGNMDIHDLPFFSASRVRNIITLITSVSNCQPKCGSFSSHESWVMDIDFGTLVNSKMAVAHRCSSPQIL